MIKIYCDDHDNMSSDKQLQTKKHRKDRTIVLQPIPSDVELWCQ
jgi:hypothetical protein